MKIKTQKQFFIIFAIISLISALVVSFFLNNSYPYLLDLDEKIIITDRDKVIYVDLDNDGTSEQLRIRSDKFLVNDYVQVVTSDSILTDQYNFFSKTEIPWILFDDYNADGYKELVAFSKKQDSLFLSIIDIKSKSYILNRELVKTRPDSAKKNITWDVSPYPLQFVEYGVSSKCLLFYLSTGHAIYPRGIYTYDINEKKILSSFEGSAAIQDVEIENYKNNDFLITASTNAVGNSADSVKYPDNTKWLFHLDHELKPIFPPKNFGAFPGSSYAYTLTDSNDKQILFSYMDNSVNSEYYRSLLINLDGEVIDTVEKMPKYLSKPLKVTSNGKEFFYTTDSPNTLYKINSTFEQITTNSILNNTTRQFLIFMKEIQISSNKKALLTIGKESIYIIDYDLNIMAATTDFKEGFYSTPEYYYIKKSNQNELYQLGIVTPKHSLLFSLKENQLYGMFVFSFILTFLTTFIFLVLVNSTIHYFSTYIRYFGFSINKTSKGVAILNRKGGIFFSNNNFYKFLNIDKQVIKTNSYSSIFKDNTDIKKLIDNSFINNEKVKKDLSISSDKIQFEGVLTITPFTSFLGFTYACLLEVTDFTEPLLTDRGKVWGATLQRIAHEIKTPLSTIILSIDNLKNRLKSTDSYVHEEFDRIHDELTRLRELTKNFLLFSNYEDQHIYKVSVLQLVKDSIARFDSYFNGKMELELLCDDLFVEANPTQLSQFFPLIIENAIDACGEKGLIKIKTEEIELNNNEVRKFVKITISDNGKGMNKETQRKIFEPYFSTKKHGTGMGLSLAKKIIEDNKGKITIESKEGFGTKVIVYIPQHT